MPWTLFTEFSSACSLLFEKAEGIFRDCKFCFVLFILLREIKDMQQWTSPVLFVGKTPELFSSAEVFHYWWMQLL